MFTVIQHSTFTRARQPSAIDVAAEPCCRERLWREKLRAIATARWMLLCRPKTRAFVHNSFSAAAAAAAAGDEGTDDESAAEASGANVPWFAFSSSSL